MRKKIVILLSMIILFGILSVKGLSANTYSQNKFEVSKDDEFTWDLDPDINISKIIISVPEKITIEDTNKNNGKIKLSTKNDIEKGVHIVTAYLIPKLSEKKPVVYSAAVMVGITTDDELNEVKNDIEDKMDDAESNINSIEGDVSTLSEDLSSIQDSLDTAKTNISNLEQSLSDEEKKRKGLGDEIENVKTQISNLEGRLDESKERLNKLESTTATGMIITSASLGIGVIILVFILIYVAYRKGWIESLKRLIREKALKKEPWEK